MKTNMRLFGIILLALALCVPAAWAQQKDPRVNPPVDPLPPLSPGESSSRATAVETPPGAAAPSPARGDRQPLTSSSPWTLGAFGGGRSFLVPSLSIFQGFDTNPRVTGSRGVESASQFSGRMAFQHVRSKREFALDYTGGGRFHTQNSDLNAAFHQLGLSYKAEVSRWNLLFEDEVGYSTEAGAGFGGGTGLPRFSQTTAFPGNLGGFVTPLQSILTSRAPRISNTVLGEVQYAAGRRSAFTFSASYGLLHFLESGFVDGRSTSLRGGYNYALTSADTLALSYGASLLRFDDSQQQIDSHSVHVEYGRRITGRLAIRIAGGPQVSTFANAVNGSGTLISWNVRTSLLYRHGAGDMQLSYSRGVTAGSGVLVGAQTSDVRAALGRQIGRTWRANWEFGYARNAPLQQTSTTTSGFDTWNAGTSFSRPVGRSARLFLRYGVQRQTTNIPGASVGLRHTFGIGFDFRFRPIDFD